jgi:nucleoside-diphosphate-sugar epimerase
MVAAVHALEQAASEMPIGVILRYGLFYGDGTWFSRNGLTSEQIQRGEITATDGITSFIHVADAASAALLALDWEAGAVNIVDDAPAPGREWVPLYAQLIGAPSPPIKSGGQAWERGASNAKARRRGWQPRYPTWREGFQAVLRLP